MHFAFFLSAPAGSSQGVAKEVDFQKDGVSFTIFFALVGGVGKVLANAKKGG